MKSDQMKRKAVLLFAGLFMAFVSYAQESPRAKATGKAGNANITIDYGSPSVRGRKVWGELVPFGQVWRAGANEATTFETDKPITIEGKSLAAGKYGFFVVPTEKEWTIIFNSVPNQWGAYKYDKSKDVLKVTVTPKKSASANERLVYHIDSNGFTLDWENLSVPVSVKN